MSELTPKDIENVVDLAKQFISDSDYMNLYNNILNNDNLNNFRKIYGDDYIDVIHSIIIEYGTSIHVQSGGCPPCIAFLARIFGKKVGMHVIKKGIKSGVKKKSKKIKRGSKKRLKKHVKRRARESFEDDDDNEERRGWFW